MTHFKHFFIGQYLRSNYKELLVSVPQLYKKCTHTTFWTNFELKDVFQVNCCIKLHFDNWAGAAAGNKHPTCCQTILCCWNCISRKLDILSDLCQKVKISRTNHQASKQDQKDLLNLPLCKVMNCFINFSHCEGQNLTEFQSSKMAVVVLPQLASTCLNRELRSSNRVKPSRLGLNLPQLQVEVIQ